MTNAQQTYVHAPPIHTNKDVTMKEVSNLLSSLHEKPWWLNPFHAKPRKAFTINNYWNHKSLKKGWGLNLYYIMELEMLELEIFYHFSHILFVSFIGNRVRLSLKTIFWTKLKSWTCNSRHEKGMFSLTQGKASTI
jgi:hypothetical protein